MHKNLFTKAVKQFDIENGKDPRKELYRGKEYPKELLYAKRMTKCLKKMAPDASEALQLAVRCQHICRWVIPRKDYPMDRPGYHRWRIALKKFHMNKAEEILKDVGYDKGTIQRVQELLSKTKIKADEESQLLEDIVCLVFLEYYFSDFIEKHDEEKVVDILKGTWKKMSGWGHKAALALTFSLQEKKLIQKALKSGA